MIKKHPSRLGPFFSFSPSLLHEHCSLHVSGCSAWFALSLKHSFDTVIPGIRQLGVKSINQKFGVSSASEHQLLTSQSCLLKNKEILLFLQNRLLIIYCSSVYEQFFQLHCCLKLLLLLRSFYCFNSVSPVSLFL